MRWLALVLLAACAPIAPTVTLDPPRDDDGPPEPIISGLPDGGDGGAAPASDAASPSTGKIPATPPSLCAGCRLYVPKTFTSLLVALHGDEGYGDPASATAGVIAAWSSAAESAGYVVLAIPSKGDGAYSDWLAEEGYHPSAASLAYFDAQVDAVEKAYGIDPKREYLAGWSGGAYWLGYYAQARADRYAAVAFIAGGMPAYTSFNGCPARAMPAYFLGGNGDPRTAGQMSDTAKAFQDCGSMTELDLFEGDHEQTIASLTTAGRATKILSWFSARPRQ